MTRYRAGIMALTVWALCVPAWAQDKATPPGTADSAAALQLSDDINQASDVDSEPAPRGVVMMPRTRAAQPLTAEQVFPLTDPALKGAGYVVGINDMLEISVLEPEELLRLVRVAPDGTVTFPYIGSILVKGLDIPHIQEKVQTLLADGYLKYPVVLVSLKESNSKQYSVYGEVSRPGTYPIEEYSTVMRAISVAGGFTRFGSSSRVKILRPRSNGPGYDTIKIDINKVMAGDSTEDVTLQVGDMIVVSEGVF